MCIDRAKLREVVASVLAELDLSRLNNPDERRLSAELGALPIGTSLWALVLLTPDGEVIATGLNPGELERLETTQELIRVIIWGAERYPKLAPLIPNRPSSARNCPMCNGLGAYSSGGAVNASSVCIWCGGVGWDLADAELAVAPEPAPLV